MCHAWKKQTADNELSVGSVDLLLGDRYLSRSLERINLTGGEPTLYPNLLDAIKIFIKRCPSLKSIDMPTNGLEASVVEEKVETILAALFSSRARLSVTISLDGVGDIAEKVRGVPGAFERVDKTINMMKELGALYRNRLSVNINATVSKINFNKMEELKTYAAGKEMGINFTPAAISEIGVESAREMERFAMGRDEKKEVILFFEKLVSDSAIDRSYGEFVINWLRGNARRAGCVFRDKKAFLVEPSGNVYLCGNFKEFLLGNINEKSFSDIWGSSGKINSEAWKRCCFCASNCYM